MELKEEILKEIETLLKLNYSIDEISEIIKEKYNLDEEIIRELIKERYSLIYLFYNNTNKKILIIGFFSFLISSLVFNNAFLASYLLVFIFYTLTVLDYLSFTGKINYNLSNFFSVLSFISFLFISILSIKKYFFVPIVSLTSIFESSIKTLKKKENNILKTFFLIDFFYNILRNSIFFLISFLIVLLSLFLGNIFYSFLFLFLLFLIIYLRTKKTPIFFLLMFLFLFVFSLSNINKVLISTVVSLENLYNTNLKESGFYPFLDLKGFSQNILDFNESDIEENKTKIEKYKQVLKKKINNIRNCRVDLEELGYLPNHLADSTLYLFLKNDYFVKNFEEKLNKIHLSYLNILEKNLDNINSVKIVKELIIKLQNIDFVICEKEKT